MKTEAIAIEIDPIDLAFDFSRHSLLFRLDYVNIFLLSERNDIYHDSRANNNFR
jgi:hypothetical protein